MDGGSQDKTVDILKKHDDVITHWESAPDNGQYDAIQKGFAKSTGEILYWLNADDMLLPRSLRVVSEVFQQFNQVEWLSTLKPGGWDAQGFFTGHWSVPGFCRDAFLDGLNLPVGKKGCFCIQQESTFWRRSLWEKIGSKIPEEYPLAGDFALWAEFYKHADLYGIDYPLAGFRTLEGQRSQEIESYAREAKIALDGMREYFQWKQGIRSAIMYNKALRAIKKRSRFRRAHGYKATKITKINPNKPNSKWEIKEYRFIP